MSRRDAAPASLAGDLTPCVLTGGAGNFCLQYLGCHAIHFLCFAHETVVPES
jgi:hypothetical protein